MSYNYSWDSTGIYKDGRYLDMNNPKTRQALENDPYGQQALAGYRSGTSGKAGAASTASTPSTTNTASQSSLNDAITNEIKRKAQAGIPLTDPTPEKQSIYDSYISGGKTTSTGTKTQAQPGAQKQQEPKEMTMQDYLAQLSEPIGSSNMPYEQLLRDMLAAMPKTEQKSPEELLGVAQNYASLNITPQLEALKRSIEQAGTTAEAQKEAISAAYAGVPAQAQAALDEARRYAQESAIARGAGQSGVVNWETEKRTTPIIQQSQQLEGEKAAKLAGIANWLADVESQGEEQKQQLASRQGDLTQQYLQLLDDQGKGRTSAEWERTFNAVSQLANMAQGANVNAQNWAANLLPYYLQTAGEEYGNQLNAAQLFGEYQQPQVQSAPGGTQQQEIDYDNEKRYLLGKLEEAKKANNKGLESWVLAQAKSLGINLGV